MSNSIISNCLYRLLAFTWNVQNVIWRWLRGELYASKARGWFVANRHCALMSIYYRQHVLSTIYLIPAGITIIQAAIFSFRPLRVRVALISTLPNYVLMNNEKRQIKSPQPCWFRILTIYSHCSVDFLGWFWRNSYSIQMYRKPNSKPEIWEVMKFLTSPAAKLGKVCWWPHDNVGIWRSISMQLSSFDG